MPTELKFELRKLQGGCGIYETGGDSYLKLFVTDGGRVIPVNHRIISEDDLIEAYNWGRLEAQPPVVEPSSEVEVEDLPF